VGSWYESRIVVARDLKMAAPAYSIRQYLTYTAHLYKAVFNQYHMALRPLFARYVSEGATVFDVGAQAAQFTKHFAALAPKGHVYAFEPGDYARRVLSTAVNMRGMRNVTVVPVGLSDQPGEAVLTSPIKKGGSIGFGLSHLGRHEGDQPVFATTVSLTTLDTFVAEHRIQALDFLKADIEGWEIHMLRGGLRTLKRFRPPMLLEIEGKFLARAGSAPEDAWNLLGPLGYRASQVRLDGTVTPVNNFMGGGDYLFVADRQ
jgi:FkbM family methyltransferase